MSRIILFNKPYNVLSQFTDGGGRETLADYIPLRDVYPAGRLDRDSEGLLLLTDDGRLQHLISHPRHKMNKTYWVQVEGMITQDACERLMRGIELKDGPAVALSAETMAEPAVWERHPPVRFRKHIPTSWLKLVIDEGRNRQVRRMTAALGYPTLRLIRYAIGEWDIDGITTGQWREAEINPAVLQKLESVKWKGKRDAVAGNKGVHRKIRLAHTYRRRQH